LEILSAFNLQHPRALRYCPPYAIAPAAGPGAAPLRCLPPPVPAQRRCTPTRCLAPLLPLPVPAQRRCAPALPPAAGPGAAPLRPYTLSSHVQRATFNLQPLALRASRL